MLHAHQQYFSPFISCVWRGPRATAHARAARPAHRACRASNVGIRRYRRHSQGAREGAAALQLAHTTPPHAPSGRRCRPPRAEATRSTPPSQVEELRRSFTERRHESHHSSDELLRLQMASTAAARGLAPPPKLPPRDYLAAAAPSGKAAPTPREETVAGSLLSGLGFYQTLQQPDGHFAGAARCGRAPTTPCSSARAAASRAA